MVRVRVCDLAKELGTDAKELIVFLKEKMGMASIHHLSKLEGEVLGRIPLLSGTLIE